MAATGAPVEHRAEIVIDAPVEEVWATQVDLESWPHRQPGISEVEFSGPLEVGSEFDWRSGRARIRSTITTVDPPTVLAWTGSSFGVTATHLWRLTADGDTTRVITHETMDGWPARLLRGYLRSRVEVALTEWLDALRLRVEIG